MSELLKCFGVHLHLGDCLESMRGMADHSVDSIVTDPPYELGFMGKKWDSTGIANSVELWREAMRVLKPGGHLLAFSGTRTQHRMVCAIEDAGFEIRDQAGWMYGSGFPKSLDVSKAIDKAAGRIGQSIIDLKQRLIALADASGKTRAAIDAECGFRATNYLTLPAEGKRPDPWVNCLPPLGKWQRMKVVLGAGDSLDEVFAHAERDVIGTKPAAPGVAFSSEGPTELDITAPATDAARQWQGWGTALKPAWEPICVARKPLDGTVAANVLAHGTGALNIDGCRVPHVTVDGGNLALNPHLREHINGGNGGHIISTETARRIVTPDPLGRWPANLIHDGSDEVLSVFPQASGAVAPVKGTEPSGKTKNALGEFSGRAESDRRDGGGSAARFFYCAKASKSDRGATNNHPTVKPTELMRYLCRLVTPPGGVVLDPFMGSGSTGKAAVQEGFQFIGCEMSPEYLAIATERITGVVM